MLPFFFRLLLQVALITLFYFGDRLSWDNLTLGLQNVPSGRSLGLRVGPELSVTFRLEMQMFALVSWDGR